jgi:hypothetical protein
MKHLLEFESYESSLNEAKVPVYNEAHYRGHDSKPEMSVPTEDLTEIINIFLGSQASGEIEMVVVETILPSQGKNAPEYIKREAERERERMAKRKYAIYGSRTERDDRPEDDYTDAINIFTDVEFVVTGVGQKDGAECVFAIPRSFYIKTKRQPELASDYTICILPEQIEQVTYVPTK